MSFFQSTKPKWRRRRKRSAVRDRARVRALRARDWQPQEWFFRASNLERGFTATPQQKQTPRRVAPSRLSPAPHLRKAMPKRYVCRYRRDTSATLFESDVLLDPALYVCGLPADIEADVEQPKPVAVGTLDPYRNADLPGTEYVDPAPPDESFARDKDGTLVPEGSPYDTGPFAALLRFPTRFLPDSIANGVTVRAVPVLFWALVAWVIWKAFRR